ncbi:MAG: HAD-IA family hydrolase [Longimicrobiales bacterium]
MTRPASQVEAVLFDAGNTLIYVDPERLAALLRNVGAETVTTRAVADAERDARRLIHAAVADGHTGTEPEVWREYFLRLFRDSGVPPALLGAAGDSLRATHRADHLWTHVAPGTLEALEELRDAGIRLAVISNADGRVEGVLERVGLRGWFEFVLDSEIVGVTKPDPAIFLEGCHRLGLEPAACLYVGDLLPVDYVGATAAGLQGVLLDPFGIHAGVAPTVERLADLPAWVAQTAGN